MSTLRNKAEEITKNHKDFEDGIAKDLRAITNALRVEAEKEGASPALTDIYDKLEALDSRMMDLNALTSWSLRSELEEVSGLADDLNANEAVHAAVKKAEAYGAWGTVCSVLEAASYAAAQRHGAHNVEAQTLEALMQYRA